MKGFETFDACAYSFLIKHKDSKSGKERRLVFDLGGPKDYKNDLPPAVVHQFSQWGCEVIVDKYVSEILEENGVPLDSIEAVVWR